MPDDKDATPKPVETLDDAELEKVSGGLLSPEQTQNMTPQQILSLLSGTVTP